MPQAESGQPPLRWNWTAPIIVSPHDKKTHLHGRQPGIQVDRPRSVVGGRSAPISPTDLNRDELTIMGVAGRSITVSRNDGMSSFGNIFALAESPKRAGLLYAGTDDGNVQISQRRRRDLEQSHEPDRGRAEADLREPPHAVGLRLRARSTRRSTATAATTSSPGSTSATTSGRRGARSATTCRRDRSTSSRKTRRTRTCCMSVPSSVCSSRSTRARTGRAGRAFPTVAVYDLVVHPRDNDLVARDARPQLHRAGRHHAAAAAQRHHPGGAEPRVRHRAGGAVHPERKRLVPRRSLLPRAESRARRVRQLLPAGGGERRRGHLHQRPVGQGGAPAEGTEDAWTASRRLGSARRAVRTVVQRAGRRVRADQSRSVRPAWRLQGAGHDRRQGRHARRRR